MVHQDHSVQSLNVLPVSAWALSESLGSFLQSKDRRVSLMGDCKPALGVNLV